MINGLQGRASQSQALAEHSLLFSFFWSKPGDLMKGPAVEQEIMMPWTKVVAMEIVGKLMMFLEVSQTKLAGWVEIKED